MLQMYVKNYAFILKDYTSSSLGYFFQKGIDEFFLLTDKSPCKMYLGDVFGIVKKIMPCERTLRILEF